MKRFPALLILVIGSLLLTLAGCGGLQSYTAGGRITVAGDPPGPGVSGIPLFLLHGSTPVQTDLDGNWTASLKGTVKVVPGGLDWTFAPASADVKSGQTVADFAATANTATVTALAAGGWHTLALMSDGKVFSWGNATYGQLGMGGTADRIVLPVQTNGPAGIESVSGGGLFSVARKSDRTLVSWGYGLNGELGNSSSMHSALPVAVNSTLANFTAVAAGWSHTLALNDAGEVWAWGLNNYGQIGNGSASTVRAPVKIEGLADIVAIAAGAYHSLALKSDGTVYAWGYNHYGQLGTGNTVSQRTPVVVMTLSGTGRGIAAGAYHSAAIEGGNVHVWGRNSDGQLGDGLTGDRDTPYQLTTISGVTQIAAGGAHTLALVGSTINAWGNNQYGQLGDGTTTNRPAPTPLLGRTFTSVAAGYWHSAALGTDGAIYTWGRNNNGQLGNGTTDDGLEPAALL